MLIVLVTEFLQFDSNVLLLLYNDHLLEKKHLCCAELNSNEFRSVKIRCSLVFLLFHMRSLLCNNLLYFLNYNPITHSEILHRRIILLHSGGARNILYWGQIFLARLNFVLNGVRYNFFLSKYKHFTNFLKEKYIF